MRLWPAEQPKLEPQALATSTTIIQPTITVAVDFYDDEQRKLFERYENSPAITKLVSLPIQIPTGVFLAYMLMHLKRTKAQAYSSLSQLMSDTPRAEQELRELIRFNGHSIVVAPGVLLPNELTEHVGEAVGLAVVSQLYDLTEADWEPIDVPVIGGKKAKALDFEIAATGTTYIQVEAKGARVDNNAKKEGSIPAHRTDIAKKKRAIEAAGTQHPGHGKVKFGTITALDAKPSGTVRCLLVDPTAEDLEDAPRTYRLLARMTFLSRCISMISPRSQIAAALATRLADMRVVRDPFELSNVKLLRGNGEPFNFNPASSTSIHSTFFSNKARVAKAPIGGITVRASASLLLFIGIQQELLDMAASQNFETLLSFAAKPISEQGSVLCVFHESRLDRMNMPRLSSMVSGSGPYRSVILSGVLHVSLGGLVFAYLSLNQ